VLLTAIGIRTTNLELRNPKLFIGAFFCYPGCKQNTSVASVTSVVVGVVCFAFSILTACRVNNSIICMKPTLLMYVLN
jgi:hypothetical protein